MEKYLNSPIKELITKFPRVAEILNGYNIGCVPCNLGSCLLKDIVSIHNLSPEDEAELLYRIEQTIYPGRQVKKRQVKPRPQKTAGELKYSPPIKRLADEHLLIKRLIALIPAVAELISASPKIDKELILNCLYFIRNYADRFHHAKEEDILFDYTDKGLDIIKTMLQDHAAGRDHVKAVIGALKKQDKAAIILHLEGYQKLLTEHIKKEDEILYPWIDRSLSTKQIGELFSKFNEAEAKFQKEVVGNCQKIVEELEKKIRKEFKKEAVK